MEKKELDKKKKILDKILSGGLDLCPRCLHVIALKNGECPHCGLKKKGDEWIMTKEAIEEKEKEKEVKEEEATGSLFDDILTDDEEKDKKGDKE